MRRFDCSNVPAGMLVGLWAAVVHSALYGILTLIFLFASTALLNFDGKSRGKLPTRTYRTTRAAPQRSGANADLFKAVGIGVALAFAVPFAAFALDLASRFLCISAPPDMPFRRAAYASIGCPLGVILLPAFGSGLPTWSDWLTALVALAGLLITAGLVGQALFLYGAAIDLGHPSLKQQSKILIALHGIGGVLLVGAILMIRAFQSEAAVYFLGLWSLTMLAAHVLTAVVFFGLRRDMRGERPGRRRRR